MAPLRRYLRITKYSVLECRIYLDNPALAHSWLLNPRDPVLPKVIESVRPLVLPKLREERERSRKKSTKKRGIKDVVIEGDFEVSIFLTETNTRHSILTKHKHFKDKSQTKLTSNSSKLTGASRDAAIDVDQSGPDANVVILREEGDEDDAVALDTIPTLEEAAQRRPKRQRGVEAEAEDKAIADSDEDPLFVDSDVDDDYDDDSSAVGGARDDPPPPKRLREDPGDGVLDGGEDEKKKLAVDISYEGFSIYGRVLCLVVKRRDTGRSVGGRVSQQQGAPAGQAMMENWITSMQMPDAATTEDGA